MTTPVVTALLCLHTPQAGSGSQRPADRPHAGVLRQVSLATPFDELILDNVNIAIRRGQVTSVLSPHNNSASTLLDLVDGRVAPSWGSVKVADQEVTRLSQDELAELRQEHIARVLSARGVPRQLSVQDNLVIAQVASGRSADLVWVDRVAGLMGLRAVLGQHEGDRVSAVRARWALARALVQKPTVVLGNEVTTGLTRSDELDLVDSLRNAAQQLDVGVVLATRDAVTASAADRIFLVNRSRVVDVTGDL
jgi:putative ABC transport system ATP-binding protein